jgi:hypothetical protein
VFYSPFFGSSGNSSTYITRKFLMSLVVVTKKDRMFMYGRSMVVSTRNGRSSLLTNGRNLRNQSQLAQRPLRNAQEPSVLVIEADKINP